MRNLLIVDDERMIREGIKNGIVWIKMGIKKVYTASSGKEAILCCQQEKIDLLLTDICMPEMTGLELIRSIKEITPGIRIIVMTAYDRFEYAQDCCHLQVHDFMLKPIDAEELIMAIKKQIEILEKIYQEKHVLPIRNVMRHSIIEKSLLNRTKEKIGQEELNHQIMKAGYGIDIPIIVVFISIIPEKLQEEWKQDIKLLSLSLCNMIIGMVDNTNAGITFASEEEMVQVLLFCEQGKNEPEELLDSLEAVCQDEYGMELKIVCGSREKNINGFLNSYREAIELFKDGKLLYDNIIFSQPDQLKNQLFVSVLETLKKNLWEERGNISRMNRIMDVFAADIENYEVSRQNTRFHCFEIASTLYFHYLNDTGKHVDHRMASFISEIQQKSIPEAIAYTKKFMEEIYEVDDDEKTEVIGKAKKYIEENITEDISVTVLAAQLYMSVSYFSRLFKKNMGMGCNEYIVKKRIRRAEKLLSTTTLHTGEIALRVGYHDKNYFSLAFKRNTGLSPTEYRQHSADREET